MVSAQALAVIGFRLVAVYAMLQGVQQLPALTYYLGANPGANPVEGFAVTYAVILILSPAIVGLLLWTSANPLARLALWRHSDLDAHPIDAMQIQRVAIATAGLVIAAVTFPEVVRSFVFAFYQAPQLDGVRHYQVEIIWEFVTRVLTLILGLMLVLGARFWSMLLWRIRTVGQADRTDL